MRKVRCQFCLSAEDDDALSRAVAAGLACDRSDAFRKAVFFASGLSALDADLFRRLAGDCRELPKARGISSRMINQGRGVASDRALLAERVRRWSVRLGIVHVARLQMVQSRFGLSAMAEAARLAVRAYARNFGIV